MFTYRFVDLEDAGVSNARFQFLWLEADARSPIMLVVVRDAETGTVHRVRVERTKAAVLDETEDLALERAVLDALPQLNDEFEYALARGADESVIRRIFTPAVATEEEAQALLGLLQGIGGELLLKQAEAIHIDTLRKHFLIERKPGREVLQALDQKRYWIEHAVRGDSARWTQEQMSTFLNWILDPATRNRAEIERGLRQVPPANWLDIETELSNRVYQKRVAQHLPVVDSRTIEEYERGDGPFREYQRLKLIEELLEREDWHRQGALANDR
jgi:hypothetical protein